MSAAAARALDISMTVRSGECIDGPQPLVYTDAMLAAGPRFEVRGLTLEELAAEKLLGWASKDLAKHYIDLAYIARDHGDRLDLDHVGELVERKFAAERHEGRYHAIPNLRALGERFRDNGRVALIRRDWDQTLGNAILFLPSEDDRGDSLTEFANVERHVNEFWGPLVTSLGS